MSKYQPYTYWEKESMKYALTKLVEVFKMGSSVNKLVITGVDDPVWDFSKEYDGCTVVQDKYHPCVSCFLHDYLWQSGQGGKESDRLFYLTMLKEGTKPFRAWRRWFMVRIGWIFYYKWAHLVKRNVNELSVEFKNALHDLETEYGAGKNK